MKVADILDRDNVITAHTRKIDEILAKDAGDLSISELAFIKRVSAGSITTMKKQGASNEKILQTSQNRGMPEAEKVRLFLKSLPEDERRAMLLL